jgi:hypothetical protein
MNFLEELVAEWYEFRGYFVRRNVLVGRRAKGGYECELDVVAFHPGSKHLVHIEPSMDAQSWAKRDERFRKKFAAGRRHIPELFSGLELPEAFDQIALLGFASKRPTNPCFRPVAGGPSSWDSMGGQRILRREPWDRSWMRS